MDNLLVVFPVVSLRPYIVSTVAFWEKLLYILIITLFTVRPVAQVRN